MPDAPASQLEAAGLAPSGAGTVKAESSEPQAGASAAEGERLLRHLVDALITAMDRFLERRPA